MSEHPDMPAWASAMEARLADRVRGDLTNQIAQVRGDLTDQIVQTRGAIMSRIDRMQEALEARLEGEVVTGAQALIASQNAKAAIEANHSLVEMVNGMQRLVRRLEARVTALEAGG